MRRLCLLFCSKQEDYWMVCTNIRIIQCMARWRFTLPSSRAVPPWETRALRGGSVNVGASSLRETFPKASLVFDIGELVTNCTSPIFLYVKHNTVASCIYCCVEVSVEKIFTCLLFTWSPTLPQEYTITLNNSGFNQDLRHHRATQSTNHFFMWCGSNFIANMFSWVLPFSFYY